MPDTTPSAAPPILSVFDDVGPEQGVLAQHQMTDDTSPTVRVSLTATASGTEAVQAGDSIRVTQPGGDLLYGQALVTAGDLARGYIDVQLTSLPGSYDWSVAAQAIDQAGNRSSFSEPFWLDFAAGQTLSRTNMTDGGYTLSYQESGSTTHTHVQRYDSGGHAQGAEIESVDLFPIRTYILTPLAGGNLLALFFRGGHFASLGGGVYGPDGALLNSVGFGLDPIITAAAQGGFVLAGYDRTITSDWRFQAFDNTGHATTPLLTMGGAITSVVAEPTGAIDIHWTDDGRARDLVVDPLHPPSWSNPPPPSQVSALDDVGPQTGTIASGATTDDTTPTLRVAVTQPGEVKVSWGLIGEGLYFTTVQVTDANVARGYVEAPLAKIAGENTYVAKARFVDQNGLMGNGASLSMSIRAADHMGTPGPDVEVAQADGAWMTGGAGADVFVFRETPTRESIITDFADGEDKLDFRELLAGSGYHGSDPFADGYLRVVSTSGEAELVFDRDGSAGSSTGVFVARFWTLHGGELSAADLVSDSPPPPPPPPPPTGGSQAFSTAMNNILRPGAASPTEQKYAAGQLTWDAAMHDLIQEARATTSVATLAYEFFTGRTPSSAGLDYLVSPMGPNPNNLNSGYYQSFSLENRYINFAVNLGKLGEGASAFAAAYGGMSLFDATRAAYARIFGAAPSDAKVHDLIDGTVVLGGVSMHRSDYFNAYGQDGVDGVGTKAAMVGWLLAEAEKADVGVYAKVNDAYLMDLSDGGPYLVDIVGTYNQPDFVYHPA